MLKAEIGDRGEMFQSNLSLEISTNHPLVNIVYEELKKARYRQIS